MNHNCYTLGVDPAKEKMTVCLLNSSRKVIARSVDLPNTREGFNALFALLRRHVPAGALVVAGVECTASLDDNVLEYLTHLEAPFKIAVIRADAAAVHRFTGPRVLRGKTDHADARRIAEFTHTYARELARFEHSSQLQALTRLVNERLALSEDLTAQKNRLRDRLVTSFPELTQVFNDPCCGVALALLRVAPTARHAATKRPSSLAKIKAPRRGAHVVGIERAHALHAEAQTSIASACDDTDAASIVRLVDRITMLIDQEEQAEKELRRALTPPAPAQQAASNQAGARTGEEAPQQAGNEQNADADIARQVAIADSMPGIGFVSAAAIVLRSGGVRRFITDKAFAAQLGVCPERNQTGSSRDTARLTRRGDRRLRAMLYMCILAATQCDLAMKFHKWRLCKGGLTPKQAQCACMNRYAKILWHLIQNNTDYDPLRAIQNAQKHHPELWKTFLQTVENKGTNSKKNMQNTPKEALI